MKTLITMHVPSEGPGTLGSFLTARNVDVITVRLYDGESLPPDPSGLDAMVSMGGPMNVYEDEKYPFLGPETLFLREALGKGIPMIGVCLGSQMIARAAGARVTLSPKKEVGWGKVSITEAGIGDTLFQGLPPTLEVLQWHEDMFDVPEEGALLATSEDCPHQAFRLGKAFGLQFHVEVTREMLSEWFAGSEQLTGILERYDHLEPGLNSQAQTLYENFLSVIG
jgi:GMP synthase-like glutamine amidotransferase